MMTEDFSFLRHLRQKFLFVPNLFCGMAREELIQIKHFSSNFCCKDENMTITNIDWFSAFIFIAWLSKYIEIEYDR